MPKEGSEHKEKKEKKEKKDKKDKKETKDSDKKDKKDKKVTRIPSEDQVPKGKDLLIRRNRTATICVLIFPSYHCKQKSFSMIFDILIFYTNIFDI